MPMMTLPFLPPSPAAAPTTPVARDISARTRFWSVTLAVAASHGAALWALPSAWQRPATVTPPRVVQVSLAPAPVTDPVPEPTPAVRPARREPVRPIPKPVARPSPTPVATQPTPTTVESPVSPEPATETAAPVASTAPPTNSPATGTPSSAPAPVTSAPVADTEPAPRIVLPSASAAYLNNPPPAYPALSRRLGEQGRVLLRVRIEPDGTASAADIRTSSGYERLDQAALQAVLSWRYVPGKRNGVPEAMWFLIPIQFELR